MLCCMTDAAMTSDEFFRPVDGFLTRAMETQEELAVVRTGNGRAGLARLDPHR